MDLETVLLEFDHRVRRDARPDSPGARIERLDGLVRQIGAEHGWSGVVWSDLDHATADAVITEQVRHFTSLGREFEWKLYSHDRPSDLAGRLRTAGFVAEPEETLMVAEVGDLPTTVELPDGIHLRPVTDPAGVNLMMEVHEQAFGTKSIQVRDGLLAALAEQPETVAAVVAMAGDLPVSSARIEMVPGSRFAGLWGGGTVTAWRGRGIYRALVAFRTRIAAERGYRYLQVDASSDSRPILQRLGFMPLTTTTPHVYRP
jgi:GNAT superfamily N-acetyltransferase